MFLGQYLKHFYILPFAINIQNFLGKPKHIFKNGINICIRLSYFFLKPAMSLSLKDWLKQSVATVVKKIAINFVEDSRLKHKLD